MSLGGSAADDDANMCPVTDAGFQPYILFAIETEKGRDGAGIAGDKGRYLELGVAPGDKSTSVYGVFAFEMTY